MNEGKSTLYLSNGDRLTGFRMGAPVVASGEIVFTTGMVGYPETITDPSFYGQILVFSYPLVGNYGVADFRRIEDELARGFESSRIHLTGVVLASDAGPGFHWQSAQSLGAWFQAQGVPAIFGVDTRRLISVIRAGVSLLARIEPEGADGAHPLHAGRGDFYDPSTEAVVPRVSTTNRRRVGSGPRRIALLDCGVKWNIVRSLVDFGCEVEWLPWDTDPSTVDCDAWVLSNGPGDPEKTGPLVGNVRKLLDQGRPVLGICLGHQLLALAAGAKTERLRYGHRSHNQPVYTPGSKRGYLTSQNHGYVVRGDTIPEGWAPWFVNANDGSIEGLRHESKPFYSVQFHPEAAAGPRDTSWIFHDFLSGVRP